jgi:alkylated DNA repair dioxygenase AlkB
MNKTHLSEKADLYFQENFLKISDEDMKYLWDICPTTRHKIKIMGKMIDLPRLQKAFGKSYSYSGTTIKGEPEPEIIKKIRLKIEEIFPKWKFNNCLANWYLDGSQYIGFHADNIKPFINGAPIVGISFCENEPRKLVIKDKKTKKTLASIKTTHCSLFAMYGENFQKKYTHGLPKQKKCGKRLSLTFRAFKI